MKKKIPLEHRRVDEAEFRIFHFLIRKIVIVLNLN